MRSNNILFSSLKKLSSSAVLSVKKIAFRRKTILTQTSFVCLRFLSKNTSDQQRQQQKEERHGRRSPAPRAARGPASSARARPIAACDRGLGFPRLQRRHGRLLGRQGPGRHLLRGLLRPGPPPPHLLPAPARKGGAAGVAPPGAPQGGGVVARHHAHLRLLAVAGLLVPNRGERGREFEHGFSESRLVCSVSAVSPMTN